MDYLETKEFHDEWLKNYHKWKAREVEIDIYTLKEMIAECTEEYYLNGISYAM